MPKVFRPLNGILPGRRTNEPIVKVVLYKEYLLVHLAAQSDYTSWRYGYRYILSLGVAV